MAEVIGVLSLIASILGILEGVDKSKTVFKKYVHSSSSLRAELVPLLGKLTAFAGLLRGFQLECELDESDNGRLQVFAHIQEPLEHCKKAAQVIVARLDQVISVGGVSLSFGKILNKETGAALHMLDQTKFVLDLALTADQKTLLKSIETYLRNVTEDVNNIRDESRIHYQDLKDDLRSIKADKAETSKSQDKLKLLDWVSQVNYSSNYYAALLPTLEEDASGDWCIKGRAFQNWKSTRGSRGLILTGISGAGKTVMCSKIIRHILQENTTRSSSPILAYFFFDFNDVAKQTVEGMVRSLIVQIIAQLDKLPEVLQRLYSKHCYSASKSPIIPLQDWCDILTLSLQNASDGYIFIDALDECGEAEDHLLTETLQTLFDETGVAIKWLLTCRPAWPRAGLQEAGFDQSTLGTVVVDKDIRHYLSTRLKRDSRLASFGPVARDLIVSQITSKSAGMFRFAQCQLDSLAKLKDRRLKKVKEVLKIMPGDISSTYHRILDDLRRSDDWVIVERVLSLVSYSARPVSLAEVAEFAILEDDMTTVGIGERLEDFTEILSLLSSFITVQDGNVTLAHKSVQDFMASLQTGEGYGLLRGEADEYIARRCLQYLAFPQKPARDIGDLKSVKDPNAQHLATLLVAYPFLGYAASRWPHHTRTQDVQSHLVEGMRLVLPFTHKPNLWKAWLMLQRVDIWETQLQLARLLCEALIRSVRVPSWAYGFWEARQNYRVITQLKQPTKPMDENGESIAVPTDRTRASIADCEAALKSAHCTGGSHVIRATSDNKQPLIRRIPSESHIDFYVRARQKYTPASDDRLAFLAHDRILVVEKQSAGIWKGTLYGRTGVFPAHLVIREPREAPSNITGEIYYELAAILLEVALQTSLSIDLKLLLAKVTSKRSLEILLCRLEVLITQAANILGNRYGSVVREALSNVRYAQGRDSDLYETQDYTMNRLHSPLQHMLESGFRASRSPVAVTTGKVTPFGLATESAPYQASRRYKRGELDMQYSAPSRVSTESYCPTRRPGTYDITHTAYDPERFSAPQSREFSLQNTQADTDRHSTTAVP